MTGTHRDTRRGWKGDRGQNHHRLSHREARPPPTRGPHPRGQQHPGQDPGAAAEHHRGESGVPEPQDPAHAERESESTPQHHGAQQPGAA